MSKAHWGVASFYALMLVAVWVFAAAAGQRASGLYWLAGIFYALRGDMLGLRKLTLWALCFLGAAFLIWVALILGSGGAENVSETAWNFALSAAVLSVIYEYLRKRATTLAVQHPSSLSPASAPASLKAQGPRPSVPFVDASGREVESQDGEEEHWANALDEYEGSARRQGLYAQLFNGKADL